MKRCILLLLPCFLFSGCSGTNGDFCDVELLPNLTLFVALLEEDSQQSLIGDRVSGGIYDTDKITVYLDGEVQEDGLKSTDIQINDWHDPLISDSLLTLEYYLDLPDTSFINGIDRDTLIIEYLSAVPECRINPVTNTEESREMTFLRVLYNGIVHYEGEKRTVTPIRLDRI